MAKYKIKYNRPECIGCGVCAANCPKFWEMDDNEGKSNLKGAENLDNGSAELEIDDNYLECNMEAAESCPVNVIHIIDKDSGEKKI